MHKTTLKTVTLTALACAPVLSFSQSRLALDRQNRIGRLARCE